MSNGVAKLKVAPKKRAAVLRQAKLSEWLEGVEQSKTAGEKIITVYNNASDEVKKLADIVLISLNSLLRICRQKPRMRKKLKKNRQAKRFALSGFYFKDTA